MSAAIREEVRRRALEKGEPPPPTREPSAREVEAIASASKRIKDTPPRLEYDLINGKLESPHSDVPGHAVATAGLFGASYDFALDQVHALNITAMPLAETKARSTISLNAALALVAAVNPENELESALAVQMAQTHALATAFAGNAKTATMLDQTERYVTMATKLQRTFAAQIEALAKLRNAGKQVVEVRHVHVYPGGQAVIGNVTHNGAAGGGQTEKGKQSDAKPEGATGNGPAMLGQDAGGLAMPRPGREGAEAMPDARRDQSRGAKGPSKREFQERPVDAGGHRRASGRVVTVAGGQGPADPALTPRAKRN